MRISLKTKLIMTLLLVVVMSGFVTTWVGVRFIGRGIITQAQDKVRMDLNSAEMIYEENLEKVDDFVRLTAVRFFLSKGFIQGDLEEIKRELERARKRESLDILTLTDKDGVVLFRARNPGVYGDKQTHSDIVSWALFNKEAVVSTEIVSRDELIKEGEDLAEQALIRFIRTPKARNRPGNQETSGMMMKAAAPVLDRDGDIIGVLYGGILLNRNYQIVDRIKDTVYQGEIYGGKDVGTSTIFQGDLRIATNVILSEGKRAIGTRVSKEVYEQVIENGLHWVDRAFVVNDWYITAYRPIKNMRGKIIGMVYVGMLEAPYTDLKNRILFTFSGIAFLTAVFLLAIAYFTAGNIIRPLGELLFATKKIARGNLSYRVKTKSRDEIGELGQSFNKMTEELEKANRRYMNLMRTLEDRVKEKTEALQEAQDHLVQSEKLTALGKMAAGIAHEINNPLTAILINGHLMLEKCEEDTQTKDNLQMMIDETRRCSELVSGLLEFSRQTPTKKQFADINTILEATLSLFESQIMAHRVKVIKKLDKILPKVLIDISKIKQVFTNIILNALDAMPGGGVFTITSKPSASERFIEIKFQDSGCGMSRETMGRIFDPFYTTKGTEGTGLGLSVSYGIMEQHEGKIEVQSELGKGTIMTLILPSGELDRKRVQKIVRSFTKEGGPTPGYDGTTGQ